RRSRVIKLWTAADVGSGDADSLVHRRCRGTGPGASCRPRGRRGGVRPGGEVRLPGSPPTSACLVPEQEGGQLASIGREMIVAATKLNAEARRVPSGPAAVELGYLIGAVSKGADWVHPGL